MGVYIKGMEMPKEDEEIFVRISSDGTVMTEYANPIPWATAVPVPPHGRLIEADFALENMHSNHPFVQNAIRATIKAAPTIIPAEEGEI